MPISSTLGAIRYYTKDDPYFYTVDNRPLQDIAANILTLANTMDTMLNGTLSFTNVVTLKVTASNSSDHISFMGAGGTEQVRILEAPNSVNYLQINGAATAGQVGLGSRGTDANIPLVISTKGSGRIAFVTNSLGSSAEQFRISHTAAAVNWIEVTGSPSGTPPGVSAQGADSNIDLNISSKGATVINFFTASARQFRISNLASAINYLQVTGAITNNAPILQASGTDNNISVNLYAKGTGQHKFFVSDGATQVAAIGGSGIVSVVSGGGTISGLQVQAINSASMALNCTNSAADSKTWDINVTSSGIINFRVVNDANTIANSWLQVVRSTTQVSTISFSGGVVHSEQFRIVPVSNTINYVFVSGSTVGTSVIIGAAGADGVINLTHRATGITAQHIFDAGGATQLVTSGIAAAVNYLQIGAAATGTNVTLSGLGTDTDVGITISPKGAGNIILNPSTGDIRWNKALVALGGGAAPTLGTIGGSGPATAAQNTWMRVLDSTGAAFWVPAWK